MFSFFTGGFSSSDTKAAEAVKPKSTGKTENSAPKAGPKTTKAPDADVKPSATKVPKPMDAKHVSNPPVQEKSQVSLPVAEKPLGSDQPAVVKPQPHVAEKPAASTTPAVTKASPTMPLPETASKGAGVGGVPATNPFATASVGKAKPENPFSNIAPRKSTTPADTTSNPFLITKK